MSTETRHDAALAAPASGEQRLTAVATQRTGAFSAALLLAFAVLAFLVSALGQAIPTEVDSSDLVVSRPGVPLLLHFQSNAVVRLPVLSLLQTLGGRTALSIYLYLTLIAGVGALTWLALQLRIARVESALDLADIAVAAALLFIGLYFGIGADIRVLSSVTCLFLCTAAAISTIRSAEPAQYGAGAFYIALVVFSFFLVRQSVVLVGIVSALAALMAARDRDATVRSANVGRYSVIIGGILLPVLLAELGGATPVPEYPEKAHLVPGYGVVDGIRPLLGSETPLPIVNRAVLRQVWVTPAAMISVASMLLIAIFLLGRRRGDSRSSDGAFGLGIVAAVLAISALLETAVLPIGYSQLAPLQGFARLFPEQTHLPLLIDFVVFGGMLLAGAALARFGTFWRTVTIMVIIVALNTRGEAVGKAEWSDLSRVQDFNRAASLFQLGRHLPSHERTVSPPVSALIASSPSFPVLRSPLWTGECPAPEPRFRAVPAVEGAEVFASSRPDLVQQMKDGNLATRWSPSSGSQQTGEWVRVSVPENIRVTAIRLASGSFHTDFPRSIQIRQLAECASAKVLWEREIDPWEGELKCTASGYPYYAEQHDVVIELPATTGSRCIEVSVSRPFPGFDWSVAELQIAVENLP